MIPITKTREGAKVVSRLTSHSEFKVDPQNIAVGNKKPIGSITFEQMMYGVNYSNAEAAIHDLMSLHTKEVGEIVINDSGISPQSIPQQTRAIFSGVVSLDPNLTGTDPSAMLDILGVQIEVKNMQDAATVATAWFRKLNELVASEIVLSDVVQSAATPHIIDMTHLDCQNHTFDTIKKLGITVEFGVTVPAKPGYGLWNAIGNETKTFGTNTYTLHYFKRFG